jgi:hypothetical protein
MEAIKMELTDEVCGICKAHIKVEWGWDKQQRMMVVFNTFPEATYIEHGLGWICMTCKPLHPPVV